MAPLVFVSIVEVQPMDKSEKQITKALYSLSYDMTLLPFNVINGDFCGLEL